MSDVFISYARSTANQAQAVAEALRALGYDVWRDDELPAHRAYAEVIEERLAAAKAVVVIWSAEAVKSEWVQSEADRARERPQAGPAHVDGAELPMPFDRIQCADLAGWTGDLRRARLAQGRRQRRRPGGRRRDRHGGWRATAAPALPTSPRSPSCRSPTCAAIPSRSTSPTAWSRRSSTRCRASGRSSSSPAARACPSRARASSAQEAARQLGVRYVLEGSVRKAGDRVRIAVQLIDAADGAQIWTDRFEDTLEDVFALQDRVALAVAGKIEPAR